MFGFGKKKISIASPIPGTVIDITAVDDKVFSQKMMGDGLAIEPTDNKITAPCDAKVILLADTLHAVALESKGIQYLIHIGLDTVTLNGEGFKAAVKTGDTVHQGDLLIEFDKQFLQNKGKPDTVVIVITNLDDINGNMKKHFDDINNLLEISY